MSDIDESATHSCGCTAHITDNPVTEPNLTKIKQEQSRYDATLEIGDADGMEEGFVATLNFAVIENRELPRLSDDSNSRFTRALRRVPALPTATQSFIAMHLPGGIGSVLTIDLLQRSDLEGVLSDLSVARKCPPVHASVLFAHRGCCQQRV